MRAIIPPGVSVFTDTDREDLVDDLMDALNALADAGCPVTLRDGRLESDAGAVIPSPSGRWLARWPARPRPLARDHQSSPDQGVV